MTFVIKVGGALGGEVLNVCSDIQEMKARGESVVLLHGGSAEANRLGGQLGLPSRYLTSPSGERSRYTDAATLDVLTMAIAGRVKPWLTTQLVRLGVPAIGLTGIDAGLVRARRTPPVRAILDDRPCVIRDDLTGRVVTVNTELLHLLLAAGYVPVISPPVIDPDAGPLNIDGDRLASAIAVALHASHLVVLSNVPGLLRDPAQPGDDPANLVTRLSPATIATWLPAARGRMRVKLLAAAAALAGGVPQVILGDGRLRSPVQAALAGKGTTLAAADPVVEEEERAS